jgi:hypothetical protein
MTSIATTSSTLKRPTKPKTPSKPRPVNTKPPKYHCIPCNRPCNTKHLYKQHLNTKKHKSITGLTWHNLETLVAGDALGREVRIIGSTAVDMSSAASAAALARCAPSPAAGAVVASTSTGSSPTALPSAAVSSVAASSSLFGDNYHYADETEHAVLLLLLVRSRSSSPSARRKFDFAQPLRVASALHK